MERLLLIVSSALDSSRHLEYYLCWAQNLLTLHGPKIKAQKNMPALLALEKVWLEDTNKFLKRRIYY